MWPCIWPTIWPITGLDSPTLFHEEFSYWILQKHLSKPDVSYLGGLPIHTRCENQYQPQNPKQGQLRVWQFTTDHSEIHKQLLHNEWPFLACHQIMMRGLLHWAGTNYINSLKYKAEEMKWEMTMRTLQNITVKQTDRKVSIKWHMTSDRSQFQITSIQLWLLNEIGRWQELNYDRS